MSLIRGEGRRAMMYGKISKVKKPLRSYDFADEV